MAGEIGENGKQKGERVSKEERIRREEASVFIVGLDYPMELGMSNPTIDVRCYIS